MNAATAAPAAGPQKPAEKPEVTSAKELIKLERAVSLADFRKSIANAEVPMPWIQWECTNRSLERRAILLADKVMQIIDSFRFKDKLDKLGVGFVNTQHGADTQAYLDEFVLYDMKNGNIEMRVIPYKKASGGKERAHVYTVAKGFKEPEFSGRWPELRKWFMQDPNAPKEEKPVVQKGPRSIATTTEEVPKAVKVPAKKMKAVVQQAAKAGEATTA